MVTRQVVTKEVRVHSARVVNLAKSNQTAARDATTADVPAGNAFRELLESQGSNQAASATSASGSQVSGLAGLATPSTPAAAAATAATNPWTPADSAGPHDIPTAEALFGAHPWLDNPTGSAPNGQTWSYNPLYFATKQTAQTVAKMVGGKVIEQNQFCSPGPLTQTQPNEMVQLSNGKVINAGEFVGFFTHGYPQYYVDQLIQQELKGDVG